MAIDIIGSNYVWISNDGFIPFCKNISLLSNLQSFTLDEVSTFYKTETGEQKTRAYLKFLINLGLINRINGTYAINNIPSVISFFSKLKENHIEDAELELKSIIKEHPFFQIVLTKFLYDSQPKKVSEFEEFLKTEDGENRKIMYYDMGSRFFSKFLHTFGFVEYNQKSQTIKLNKNGLQQKIIEIKPKETNDNLIEININCNGKKSKIALKKSEVIKWVLSLPEAEKNKVLLELL